MAYTGKYGEILSKLLARTLDERIKWKADAEELSYSVVLKSGQLVRAAWPEATAYVYLYNRDGAELFTFEEGQSEPSNGVITLWSAAKESALGINKELDQVLEDLR